MSNYDLEAKLSSLESELRHAESINRELRGELSIIERGVNRADNDLENLNNNISSNLNNCNNIMLSSHQRVLDSIVIQGEIEKMYVRFKHMELANKKIRAANNKKYYDFTNYRTVRKIVQGILDNLDIRMVSDKAILKSVEKQHLQTPDYWLTCVLLSIMAWKNYDKELTDRAMDRAIKLDKKHSAIFYMLFNLRIGRNKAALKWFYLYQECDLKGSDQRTFLMLFSLISKTLSDNIDDSAKNEIFDFIKRVISANMKASGYSEETVVERIKGYLNKMKPDDKLEYTLLRKHCLEIDKMADVMMSAKNNINILEFILKTVNVPIEQKNSFLKEYIDEIIAAPNETEKEVYDEIEYNELIIKLEGDIDKAREDFAEEQSRRENDLNLIAEMISWIYERDTKEINGQIRLNMFTLTKYLQEEAVDQIVDNYRNKFKVNYDISIGDYSTNVNFKHEDEEYRKVESYYNAERDEAISKIKNGKAYIGFGLGAAAAVGAFFVGYWLFAVTVIGACFGIMILLSNKSEIRQLEQNCSDKIRTTSKVLQDLFTEFSNYTKEYEEYDAYYDRIKNEFSKI